jgi:NADH-quinone oxidoreductase subunit L
MEDLVWLIPALPLLGAFVLVTTGSRIPKMLIPTIGIGTVALAAVTTLVLAFDFISSGASSYVNTVWQWLEVGGLSAAFGLHVDALTIVFLFVITFVGTLIHIYSAEFMADDEGYARFFAYLNLFVFSMLILVLADNLVLLYFGWEGVGLCSYLLIGFWYKEEKNGYAARKAFIITRVGDTAMAIGLFLIFQELNTLRIQDIATQASSAWTYASPTVTLVALLLLGGAVGKSAQFPLQSWLPDAMAGPSPVSALIHAATMVTAGVYLIARMHVVFELAPTAQFIVGVVGASTLLLAGCSALTQFDLKRVLAYSTISQIGYMFLALGVGAWSASIFHFMIHAFFKALLFLAAGAVILALHHEHDMFKMGGLKKKLPAVYWTFLIGAASLAALPLITAGFYSKDAILWMTWAGEKGNSGFFMAALIGAFITSVYTSRMVFLTFWGEEKTHVSHAPGAVMTIPLIVLAALSTLGGFIELPHTLGHVTLFSDFLSPVLPEAAIRAGADSSEWILQMTAGVVSLAGIYVGYLFYVKTPDYAESFRSATRDVHQFWFSGWGFDTLYNTLFVRPFVYLAAVNKQDIVDRLYEGIVIVAESFHRAFAFTQNGMLRWYVAGVVIGSIIILAIGLMS